MSFVVTHATYDTASESETVLRVNDRQTDIQTDEA